MVLTDLRDEVAGSQRQMSILTRGMGSLLADLERLSGRITSALAAVEEDAATPATVKPQPAPLTEVPKPQTGLVAAVEPASELVAETDAAIDLNALAEAETERPAAPDLVAATNGAGERQRPHWLSVTRPITTGTK